MHAPTLVAPCLSLLADPLAYALIHHGSVNNAANSSPDDGYGASSGAPFLSSRTHLLDASLQAVFARTVSFGRYLPEAGRACPGGGGVRTWQAPVAPNEKDVTAMKGRNEEEMLL